jgi:hypothetical protein
MRNFIASVEYNDLKGSVAADKSDTRSASKWLSDNGHITDNEYVIGIHMSVGENHDSHVDNVSVTFFVTGLQNHENLHEIIQAGDKPIQFKKIGVKEIDIDMSVADFFGLFKRFEVTLSKSGLLEGKTYVI